MDGHCYSGIHGYSDKGGGVRVDIPGLSIDDHTWYGHTLTSVQVLGNTKVTVSSMDDSGLSTAPLDYPLVLRTARL